MIKWPDSTVMAGEEVLGVTVCEVLQTTIPVDVELVLIHSILNPEVTHIHGLGSPYFESAIGNTSSSGVDEQSSLFCNRS